MKKNKGITLIALIITIVVLIILASVAITLSLGENGVFKKAAKAKEDTKVAQNEEAMQIAEATNSIDGAVGSSRDEQTTIAALEARIKQLEDNQTKKVTLTSGATEIATTTWTTRNVDITLNDSIENYDYLVFTMNMNSNNNWGLETVQFVPVKNIQYGESYSSVANCGIQLNLTNRNAGIQANSFFKNSKTFNIYQTITLASSWTKIRITSIEGIKF